MEANISTGHTGKVKGLATENTKEVSKSGSKVLPQTSHGSPRNDAHGRRLPCPVTYDHAWGAVIAPTGRQENPENSHTVKAKSGL